MTVSDEQIRNAVVALFKKYDQDKSGYIDKAEIHNQRPLYLI